MRLLIIIITTICLTNCIHTKISNNGKNTEDLKSEKGREICIETNQEEFFEKMINQRLSKIQGNNWDILYKDTAYIYYGYTYLTKKGLFADSIFKVKKSLISEFPKFEELNFYEINRMILNYAYKDYSFGENYEIQEAKDSFRLRGNIIFVDTKRIYKTEKSDNKRMTVDQVHFTLAVDAKTLELLSQAQLGEE